jgi:hypothetical protein
MSRRARRGAWATAPALVLTIALAGIAAATVPLDQRGRLDAERSGFHDAANIRTVFWNFGMVGDYPPDPGRVDLSVFHSAEVPKGTGMNYTDGITPFVLAKIRQRNGVDAYIMETGYRERQGESPLHNRIMRFEPRPGYFQANPDTNRGRSPAISNDPRTWPAAWPDKDSTWYGKWNGYFGKRPAADQESFTVMDDDYYDAWNYQPDSTDATRHGLGLKVQVRGFQWSNPQAANVIFWHYDITNEGTTDYDDNIIFGLYNDSGVGGSALSCDGIFESDDDNAFWDRSFGRQGSRLNLVYTWDRSGHGVDLAGSCEKTGYLGYAYLETPGNAFDGVDNDSDGIVDENRDGGPGTLIVGQGAIRDSVIARYDLAAFERYYGPLENRAAYKAGRWWTGDEDLDWNPEFDDTGADGVPDTGDLGEGDGMPTAGEPDFDRTDLDESDQIGLTGFKMNRIRAGQGNPDQTTDGIVFYTDSQDWPARLYQKFTDPYEPARFDSALASNYNIAFLFASGPFKLKAGKTERFSLALAYGSDLEELRNNVATVQQIYNANYQFAVPPPRPTVTAEAGDGYVRLSWDDVAERGLDPVTHENDFEGYRIYRSTDPEFRDPEVITTARGNDIGLRKPLKQFDLIDGRKGYSRKTIEGVSQYLGDDSGIAHTWTDTTVTNGQQYYYSVTAFDYGFVPVPYADSLAIFPSENPIAAITRTPRGGLILPTNVVQVRPDPRVLGFQPASLEAPVHAAGNGAGSVQVQVVNSNEIPDGHRFEITFVTPAPESLHASSYSLIDSTAGKVVFAHGTDFDGAGTGPVGAGMLPVIRTLAGVSVDSARTGYRAGSPTNTRLATSYISPFDRNFARTGYPDDITIEFDDVVRDTGVATTSNASNRRPAKFVVIDHSPSGDVPMRFRFRDVDSDGTLSSNFDQIDILTPSDGVQDIDSLVTWRVVLDTLGQGARGPIQPPRLGDIYDLGIARPFGASDRFVFTTRGKHVDSARASAGFTQDPYVVPNPYVEAASFEPARFAVSGRGDRRMEFRGLPQECTIRIYNVAGNLVQTLRHDASDFGVVAWDLRTKDNLDVAPGLYIFHVSAAGLGTRVGKFAIIK